MTAAERTDLLWLLTKLRAHAVSARAIGSEAEAASFEAKIAGLMAEHNVTEAELTGFVTPAAEAPPTKLHCYRVLYASVVREETGPLKADVMYRTAEKSRHVVASSEQEAGAAIEGLAPAGTTHQIQQVAQVARDVVLA